MEAYVPMQIPMQSATDRPLIDSPPNIAIAIIGSRVDVEVFTVRVRVALRDLLTVCMKSSLGCSCRFSRIRSKITTLSLIAYPIMVRMAAMNVWSTSRLNGRIPLNREKKPIRIIVV